MRAGSESNSGANSEGVGEKRKIIFLRHFSSFFRNFFFRVDVEIWGRPMQEGSTRSEQRKMRLGKSFFLTKIKDFGYFLYFSKIFFSDAP